MKRFRRFLIALAIYAVLGGCSTTAPEGGAYVSLMRDAMVEAARTAEPADHPAGAVRAVRAWRTDGD